MRLRTFTSLLVAGLSFSLQGYAQVGNHSSPSSIRPDGNAPPPGSSLTIAGPTGSLTAGQPIGFGCNSSGSFSNGSSVTFSVLVAGSGSSETGSASGNGTSNVDYTFSSISAGTYQAHCNYGSVASNYINFTVSPLGYQGYINPKFLVVGLVYAPPGATSSVSYASSNTFSNTSSVSYIFGTNTTVSLKLTVTAKIPGVAHSTITGTTTTMASQSTTSSSSTTVTVGQTVQTTYAGTPALNAPVAHDYDSVLLWLNPVTILTVFPNQPANQQIQFNGYGYDEADTNVQGPDILAIPIGCLNGDFAAANCQQYAAELGRSWANSQIFPSGQVPALTSADYAQIVQVDPFATSNYTFTTQGSPATTTDGRFTISGGPNGTNDFFTYAQAQPGQQPGHVNFTNVYTNMSTMGQSINQGYSETYGVDANFGGGTFFGNLTYDIGTSQKISWNNIAGSSVTNSNTQTDSATIYSPACNGTAFCSPAYSGPVQWNVYQDNVFGTFEFQP